MRIMNAAVMETIAQQMLQYVKIEEHLFFPAHPEVVEPLTMGTEDEEDKEGSSRSTIGGNRDNPPSSTENRHLRRISHRLTTVH